MAIRIQQIGKKNVRHLAGIVNQDKSFSICSYLFLIYHIAKSTGYHMLIHHGGEGSAVLEMLKHLTQILPIE